MSPEEGDRSPATEDSGFRYRGDLAQKPLAEILYSIDRFQVPGVLEAVRGEVVKKIFIRRGVVLHASSTDLDDSLGSYLLRSGKLSPEQHEESMRERRNSPRRFGVLLVEQGVLAPVEVYQAIHRQIQEIVWSLFSWQDGQVSFQIGEYNDAGTVRIHLPMRQVILRGIKGIADAKPLVARMGKRETVFEAQYHGESLIEMALDEKDFQLLQMVDGQRSLVDICGHGPYSVPENAKLMYAFYVMELIRKVRDEATGPPKPASSAAREGGVKIRLATPDQHTGE